MIVDLDELTDGTTLSADICLVGTGAAGLTLASELSKTSMRIILLESGGLDHEPATQALYEVDVSGHPFLGAMEGRFRVHGGSTTKWGGQALPLLPSDFQRRE